MRRLLLFLGSILAFAAQAQTSRFPPINLYTGDPTGVACTANAIVQSTTTGLLYTCQSGVYKSGGGGTGTITGVTASTGLTGGGTSGSVTVGIDATKVPFLANPNAFSAALTATRLGGQYLASQWGDKTTNGISTAAAAAGSNGLVVADPSYGTSEQYSLFGTMIPSVPTPFRFQDVRQGYSANFAHSWPINGQNFGDGGNPANNFPCLFDLSSNSLAHYNCIDINYWSTTPGATVGNTTVPVASGNPWAVPIALSLTTFVNGAGIAENVGGTLNHYGAGDTAGMYHYSQSMGGWVGASDEGTENALQTNELNAVFAGTCSTGCTTGSTQIKVNPTANANAQGTWRYIIDTTAGATATTITSMAAGLGSAEAVTVAATVPVSNAWGTLASNVQPPLLKAAPFSTSMTFNVNIVGGTQFDTTHLVCFQSQLHECAIPTAVGTPSGGVQSITIPLRKPHASGSYIFQGGMAGYGLEVTAWSTGNQKYLLDVVGSTTANVVQVVAWKAGTSQASPVSGYFNANLYNFFNVSNLSNSGTTVSGTYTSAGSTLSTPTIYNKVPIYIQGASDAAFNTVCTNLVFSSSTAFTCTIAGLSGSHTATTATAQLSTTSAPINTINLWPMAEVLDVLNESLTPPSMDGSLTLEPNVIPFAASDTIIEPPHAAGSFRGLRETMTVRNAYALVYGIDLTIQGTGTAAAQSCTVNCNSGIRIVNGQPDSTFVGSGGIQSAPNMITFNGAYQNGLAANEGPQPGQNLLYVNPTSTQKADVNYCYDVLNLAHNSSIFLMQDCPNTGNVTINNATAAGTLAIAAGGGITLSSPFTSSQANTLSGNNTLSGSNSIGGTGKTTTFTGTVTASGATAVTVPTVASGDNSTNAASTAFVKAQSYATTSQLPAVRAGTWSISAATSVAVTFSTAMGSAPTSCAITPSADPTTTGALWATSLATTGFTVNTHTSGTISGTYLCVINNAN